MIINVTPASDIPVVVAGASAGDEIRFAAGNYNLVSNIFKGDVTFYLEKGANLLGVGALFVGSIGGDFTLIGEGSILSGDVTIAAQTVTIAGQQLVSAGTVSLVGKSVHIDFFNVRADVDTSGQVSATIYEQVGNITHTPGTYGLPASFTVNYINGGSFKTEQDICFLDLFIDSLVQPTDFVLLDRAVGNIAIGNSEPTSKVQLDGSASVKLSVNGVAPVIEFFDETSNLTVEGKIIGTLFSSQDQSFALKNCTIVADGYCIDSAFPISVGIDETVTLNSTGEQINPATVTLIQTSGTLIQSMTWFNTWDSTRIDPYPLHGVVRDGDWTMVANKPTTDRPAPQPSGDPSYDLPDTPVWTEQSNASVVWTGHKYTFTKSGWILIMQAAAAELTSDTNYRIVIVDITNPAAPITSVIDDPLLAAGEWRSLAFGQALVTAGREYLIYIDVLNSGSDTTVVGGWRRDSDSNINPPLAQGWNRINNNSRVRLDKTDLASGDRSAELLGVIPGSTIQIVETATPTNFMTYSVNDVPIDSGTDVEYVTNLINSNGTIPISADCTITITIPVSSPTKYLEVAGHWPGNQPSWATVEGFLAYDGVAQVVPDNAYGIRLQFIEAYVSPDWDVLAISSGGSGGGATPAYLIPLRNFKTENTNVFEVIMQNTDLDFLGSALTRTLNLEASVRLNAAPTVDLRVEFQISYGTNNFRSSFLVSAGSFINNTTNIVTSTVFNNFSTGWNITTIAARVREMGSASSVNVNQLRLDVTAFSVEDEP